MDSSGENDPLLVNLTCPKKRKNIPKERKSLQPVNSFSMVEKAAQGRDGAPGLQALQICGSD